jgi:hypothetical protein
MIHKSNSIYELNLLAMSKIVSALKQRLIGSRSPTIPNTRNDDPFTWDHHILTFEAGDEILKISLPIDPQLAEIGQYDIEITDTPLIIPKGFRIISPHVSPLDYTRRAVTICLTYITTSDEVRKVNYNCLFSESVFTDHRDYYGDVNGIIGPRSMLTSKDNACHIIDMGTRIYYYSPCTGEERSLRCISADWTPIDVKS